MTEARLESGVPVTAGWFVVSARDARWLHNDMRAVCKFGGEGEAHFDDLGIGLYWIQPGKPAIPVNGSLAARPAVSVAFTRPWHGQPDTRAGVPVECRLDGIHG